MTDLNKGNFNGKKEIFPGKKAVLALFVNRIIDPQDHIVVCDKVQSQPACIQKLVAKYIPVVIPFVMNVSHVKMGVGIYSQVDFAEFRQKRKPIKCKCFFLQEVVFQRIV